MKTETIETNTSIVSKKQEIEERNAMRVEMIKTLNEKIELKEKELETKKYIIEGGGDTANSIIFFLEKEAQWKFSEALGVIEAVRQVKDAKKEIVSGKTKELLIGSLPLEAIYYFLTKVEGEGVKEATLYVNTLLKPVTDALGRSKNDRAELDQMVRDRGTLESAVDSGIDIENEDELLKEIQQELAK